MRFRITWAISMLVALCASPAAAAASSGSQPAPLLDPVRIAENIAAAEYAAAVKRSNGPVVGTYQLVLGCGGCAWGFLLDTRTGQLWRVGDSNGTPKEMTALSPIPAGVSGPVGRFHISASDYYPATFIAPYVTPCASPCSDGQTAAALHSLQQSLDGNIGNPQRRVVLLDTSSGAAWIALATQPLQRWTPVSPPLGLASSGGS